MDPAPCTGCRRRRPCEQTEGEGREALERSRERHLALVKASLLDEHYIDDEVRLQYLTSLPPGTDPDPEALRDPARQLPMRHRRLVQARRAGRSTRGLASPPYHPYTDMGRAQLDHLHGAARTVVDDEVPGDLVECGVGRGGGTIFLASFLAAHEVDDRDVWALDRYMASGGQGGDEAGPVRCGADLNQVRDGLARYDVLDERVHLVQAHPEAGLTEHRLRTIALLRVDAAAVASLEQVLSQAAPLLAPRSVVVVAGVSERGARHRLDRARAAIGAEAPLERIDDDAVCWRTPEHRAVPARPRRWPARLRRRPPLAPLPPAAAAGPATTGPVDLTVVVVLYDMRREADRTLTSLARSYQRDLDDVTYEVLVVDNGSHPDQLLTAEEVRSYGPEFRLIALGEEATPSPTAALNRGMAEARGGALAFMIDGAHVLTPGVLGNGLLALDAYAPAVVATQQWYLGPGQQGDAQQKGYDQQAEDRLLARIGWPGDGYRLFEVGHFIGDRDWFDGIVESNCVFVPRSLLEQVGGFDDSFSMPGGGYANLDLFERLASTPGVRAASILGEGSFHQVHGGTTTNVADVARRRDLVAGYGEHFQELRGRRLVGLTDPVHYVGSMATKAARRTRSRRVSRLAFDALRDPVGAAGEAPPAIVPDELKSAAVEAVWHSRSWTEATWLGHPVARLPTDLHAYQELLVAGRPGAVVVVGDDPGLGGRALFLASVYDQLDLDGVVVAVGLSPVGGRPDHRRITHVEGPGEDPEVAARVAALLEGRDALVLLGLGAVGREVAAFGHYGELVPVGGYLVVENTVVNGRPVVPEFGPGPHEAVVAILERSRDFVVDPGPERHTLTFNKGGFLRRERRS